MSEKTLIQAWINSTEKDLVANYNRLGLKASGNWPSTLRSEIKERTGGFTVTMYGANYTGVMESGRKPNSKQDPESLRAWVGWAGSTFLKKWVQDKGLSVSPFAVAWKIARQGIQVPNRFNAGGLVSDVITKERIDAMLKELSLYMIGDIRSDVIKQFK